MTEILNNPMCYDCDAYGVGAPTGIVPSAPGENIVDKVRVSLTKDVAYPVLFTQISVIDATKWIFQGIPLCYDSDGQQIGHNITNKTGTGFTVTAQEDATFEATCVKI